MSSQLSFLFQTDLKRFYKAVFSDDVRERAELVGGTRHDSALCEILRWGIFTKPEMVVPLQEFYQRVVAKIPEEHCIAVLDQVRGFVERIDIVTTSAFLPFIVEDARQTIASTAVADYVSLSATLNNDPLSRVKVIVGLIENDELENPGAAFGALLHMGDDRVCRLIQPLRHTLSWADLTAALNCATGFIHAATFEFYLDWLESLEGDCADGPFGVVASGLVVLGKRNRSSQGIVSTGQRPFPARSATQGQWQEAQKPVSLEAYIKSIAPRLYALERTEPPPRVMPHVLTAWGLKPRSTPMETAW